VVHVREDLIITIAGTPSLDRLTALASGVMVQASASEAQPPPEPPAAVPPADASHPDVRVAFIRRGDVYVLEARSEMRLTQDGMATEVWWTHDGRALFWKSEGGTQRWRLGGSPEPVRDGLWSPDGQAVAFTLPSGAPSSPQTRPQRPSGLRQRAAPSGCPPSDRRATGSPGHGPTTAGAWR
jgi:hypothetical protein